MKIEEAVTYAYHNRQQLEASDRAGCYCCLHVFDPKEIIEWTDDDETALCPYCYIDAILASNTGYELSEENLKRIREYWFGK